MERIGEESEEHVLKEEGSPPRAEEPPQKEEQPEQEQPEQEQPSPPKANVDDILQKLKVLFSYYASFGDRLNVTNLKASKFHKMMQDAQVELRPAHKKRIDLIFCSQNRNMPNMSFDVFLDSLPIIAQLKYSDMAAQEGPGNALNYLLQNDILPLYERLAATQTHLRIQQRYDVELTEAAVQLLKNVEDTLYDIYSTYFPWEQITADIQSTVANRSIKAAFMFLSEFEVCPAILNKTVVFNILTSVINDSNEPPTTVVPMPHHSVGGTVLTFAKFLYLIVKIAYFAYDTNPETESASSYSVAERLCFLLERMELSNGFVNLEKKTNRPHTARTSLLPSDAIIMKVMQEKGQEPRTEERPAPVESESKSGEPGPDVPAERASNENIEPGKEGPAGDAIEKYREQLRSIFQKYCAYGEPMNTTRLKSSKFLKLLRDCGLVSGQSFSASQSRSGSAGRLLKQVDADLIYTKVTGIKLPTDALQSASPSAAGMSIMMSTMGGGSKFLPERSGSPEHSGRQLLDFNGKRTGGLPPGSVAGRMMDFDQFITAIEMVVQKMMPEGDPAEGFAQIVEECLLPLDRGMTSERAVSNDTLLVLMELIKEKEMSKFLGVVHKSLYPYYKNYCTQKGLLTLEGFMRFCTDFGIFPDIVTKPRLNRIFYTIASIFSTGAGPSVSRIEDSTGQPTSYINDSFFVQAIALCALEVPYREPQPTNFEKARFCLP